MANITFRSSRIVYYGPFECPNCGVAIVKMGADWGGNSFTNPSGPIYPNTEWHPHVCDPANIEKVKAFEARKKVEAVLDPVRAIFTEQQGWMITHGDDTLNLACASSNQGPSYIRTEAAAWILAAENLSNQDVAKSYTGRAERLEELKKPRAPKPSRGH